MKNMEHVTDTILYIGCEDRDLDLFESQYEVPNGMAYNSYLVEGESALAVMDTVDKRKGDEWMDNLKEALQGRTPDYLVVQHLEPDHSAMIDAFLQTWPTAKIVASKRALQMLPNFADTDVSERSIAVGEGDTLDLGGRTLHFITAPMVHWPEVIMTYDDKDKAFFSADAFGKFGTRDADEEWDCEARRYYFNIVGKYGPQVQAVLKKAGKLDIAIICPLHGPILNENLGKYLNLYNIWSSYKPETEGVFVAVASIHGNSNKVAEAVRELLLAKGCPKVEYMDLTREKVSEAVENAFRYPKMILVASSYDAGVFPPMERFLMNASHKGLKNRVVGLVENGSWGPTAARTMKTLLEGCKDMQIVEPAVTIHTRLKESDMPALENLVDAVLAADLNA